MTHTCDSLSSKISPNTIDFRLGTAHGKQNASLSKGYRLQIRHCTSEAERLSLERLSSCDSALHNGRRTRLSLQRLSNCDSAPHRKQAASLLNSLTTAACSLRRSTFASTAHFACPCPCPCRFHHHGRSRPTPAPSRRSGPRQRIQSSHGFTATMQDRTNRLQAARSASHDGVLTFMRAGTS